MPETEITQYVTHAKPKKRRPEKSETVSETAVVERKKRRRRGVLVAEKVNGVPIIGWSLCHLGKDKFKRETALKIARDRIRAVAEELDHESEERRSKRLAIPHTIRVHLDEFQRRCERYFKVESPEIFGRIPVNGMGWNNPSADSEEVPTD